MGLYGVYIHVYIGRNRRPRMVTIIPWQSLSMSRGLSTTHASLWHCSGQGMHGHTAVGDFCGHRRLPGMMHF